MIKRVHVLYSGMVQGVGFRYTARYISKEFEVFGWVKNLNDGRVELVAEAEEDVLKSFVSQISQALKGRIRDTQVEWLDATGEFSDFSIKLQ